MLQSHTLRPDDDLRHEDLGDTADESLLEKLERRQLTAHQIDVLF